MTNKQESGIVEEQSNVDNGFIEEKQAQDIVQIAKEGGKHHGKYLNFKKNYTIKQLEKGITKKKWKLLLTFWGKRKMALNRTIDMLVKDLVDLISESIQELEGDKSEMALGQRLAYVECLEIIKGEIAGSEKEFGLDGDLDKKFGLIK